MAGGRKSAVGIATRYGLNGPGFNAGGGENFAGGGENFPDTSKLAPRPTQCRRGREFSRPIQTGPESYAASCTTVRV
jgi:hypothetical protein